MIDYTSLKLTSLTFLGGIFTIATKSDIVFFVTMLAGITSIIYNVLKIRKELKK